MLDFLLNKEKHLVTGCLKGDLKCQEQLYKQFASKMLNVCYRFTKNKMEAEDVLQEGFIQVFNNLGTYKFEGSLEGWVRRIMTRTAINFYHKNKKYSQSEEIDSTGEYEGNIREYEINDEDAVDKLSHNEIIKLVDELPEGYRMVFNLYSMGYTHKEIGEELNISENTSKSQFSRARKILQDKILKLNEVII